MSIHAYTVLHRLLYFSFPFYHAFKIVENLFFSVKVISFQCDAIHRRHHVVTNWYACRYAPNQCNSNINPQTTTYFLLAFFIDLTRLKRKKIKKKDSKWQKKRLLSIHSSALSSIKIGSIRLIVKLKTLRGKRSTTWLIFFYNRSKWVCVLQKRRRKKERKKTIFISQL